MEARLILAVTSLAVAGYTLVSSLDFSFGSRSSSSSSGDDTSEAIVINCTANDKTVDKVALAEEDVCRALVLSGGGSNGAWEAGVIYGLSNYGDPNDFAYDVITGVSAGSLNSSILSAYEPGDERAFAQYASEQYRSLGTQDVWKDWAIGGKVEGLTLRSGVVNNAPLSKTLKNLLEPFDSFKRRVTISATNVNEGIYTEFDQTNITFDQVADAAVASASIPGVFPPFHWEDGRIFMDGMAIYNLNIEAAVRQCMDVVDDESKIIMDVLLCGSNAAPSEE